MSCHPEQWIDTVVTRFPTLSKPQACGLLLWSFGMIFGALVQLERRRSPIGAVAEAIVQHRA